MGRLFLNCDHFGDLNEMVRIKLTAYEASVYHIADIGKMVASTGQGSCIVQQGLQLRDRLAKAIRPPELRCNLHHVPMS